MEVSKRFGLPSCPGRMLVASFDQTVDADELRRIFEEDYNAPVEEATLVFGRNSLRRYGFVTFLWYYEIFDFVGEERRVDLWHRGRKLETAFAHNDVEFGTELLCQTVQGKEYYEFRYFGPQYPSLPVHVKKAESNEIIEGSQFQPPQTLIPVLQVKKETIKKNAKLAAGIWTAICVGYMDL